MRFLALAILWITIPITGTAQVSFEGAKGTISVLSSRPLALTADFTQSGIALDGFRQVMEGDIDPNDPTKLPGHVDVSFHAGVAAEKGKRTLFSNERFTPGYEFAVSAAYVDELEGPCRETLPDGSCKAHSEGGYHGPYAAFRFENTSRKTALSAPPGLYTFELETETTVTGSIGYRFAPTEIDLFGLTFDRAWNNSSTETADEMQVCTERQRGSDADGNAVIVSSCEQRYIGGLPDLTIDRARLDYARILRFSDDKPGLAVISSFAWSHVEGTSAVGAFAFGPAILAAGNPYQSHGGLFFTVERVKTLRDVSENFRDHFGIRLFVSIGLPQI